MDTPQDKLRDALNSRFSTKQNAINPFPAILGDGSNNVNVTGRPNFVYYRSGDRSGEVYNERVSAANDLHVWIGVDPSDPARGEQVLAANSARRRYGEDSRARGMVQQHGRTHTFPNDDAVFIQMRQFLPLLVQPTETPSMSVVINRAVVQVDDNFEVVDTQSVDLSSYAIEDAGEGVNAKYMLIEIQSGGSVGIVEGSEVAYADLATSDIPTQTTGSIPVAAVRIYSGQSAIVEARANTDIIDLRIAGYGTSGGGGFYAGYVDLDTAFAGEPEIEGRLSWNSDRETMDVGMAGGVTLQTGQETHFYVKNQTGSQIDNGTVCMFAGSLGASGILLTQPAVTDGTYPATYVMGIATQDIANGENGKVTWFGELRGIPTDGAAQGETWNDGDILYPDPVTAGELTNVEPTAPNQNIPIAAVVNAHATNGTIFVRAADLRSTLEELHNVNGTTPLDGYGLIYDAGNEYWDAADLSATYLKLDASNDPITGALKIDGSADAVQLTIEGNATQTANILEIQNSAGTVLAGVDERGILFSDGGTVASNLFVGVNAGNNSAVGGNNIGIGNRALEDLTNGSGNIALGGSAGRNIDTGNNNFALGNSALSALTAGSANVAIGDLALSALQNTGGNVAIGTSSLRDATTAQSNVAIGGTSGRLLTTGQSNIFIGKSAGYRQTTNSNLLIIDNQTRADAATEATNAILYGVMAATPASQSLRINASLQTSQGRIVNTTRVTTTYTALVTDHAIFADTDGGAFTITLPAGVEGQHIRISNVGTSGNVVTVDGSGAETVYGAATQLLYDGEVLDMIYNSTEGWF